MAVFEVTVRRKELWMAKTQVQADTGFEALHLVDTQLTEKGWDGVFENEGTLVQSETMCVPIATRQVCDTPGNTDAKEREETEA